MLQQGDRFLNDYFLNMKIYVGNLGYSYMTFIVRLLVVRWRRRKMAAFCKLLHCVSPINTVNKDSYLLGYNIM
jgi:hypothetical protein